MSETSAVTLPVDHLVDLWPERFSSPDFRLGALLHSASVNASLVTTLEVLESELVDANKCQLGALYGPQHGFDSTTQDNMIEWSGFTHPRLGVPVFSLYGKHREPTPEMLEPIDGLFVDLVDVGARYYTFIWTLFLCMKACEKAGKPVIVADRPNPINGVTTEGWLQQSDHLSFVGLHPIQQRHAKTIGELAVQFRDGMFPEVDLTVLSMEGWDRTMFHDETGLPWVLPSPNMPTLDTAIVYPGMCLLEATNLSEGRGTTRPFELFGAPYISDSAAFAAKLNRLDLAGVHFREASFLPTFQKHEGVVCRGAQFHVSDRNEFRSLEATLEILKLVREDYPGFAFNPPPYEYETEKLPIEILLGKPVGDVFSIQ